MLQWIKIKKLANPFINLIIIIPFISEGYFFMLRFIFIFILWFAGALFSKPLQGELGAGRFSFMSYNIKNYLSLETYSDGKLTGNKYKPKQEIDALVKVISESAPDILGVCEIGNEKDLAHFKAELIKKGLEYPYTEHIEAGDSVRNLALLSKYPIIARSSQDELTYRIGGKRFPLRRGLLHVEIKVGETCFHALGAHLKSQRPSSLADQDEMRLKEAYLIRRYVDDLLELEPEAHVLVYGDFNDSFRSNTIGAVKGHYRSQINLTPMQLADSRGEYWTHYWYWQKEYKVFDYLFCNSNLKKRIVKEESHIIDTDGVLVASDHRPLLAVFDFSR